MDRRHFLTSTATGSIALMAANRQPLSADGTPDKKEEEIRVPKSKVLIVVGDATETFDSLYPYYRLIEAGFQPVVTAPEKRLYQMVLHEVKPGWTITNEWEGYSINADIAFKDIQPEEYIGIFFSGGRAPEVLNGACS